MSSTYYARPARRAARRRAGASLAIATLATLLISTGCSNSGNKPEGNQEVGSPAAATGTASPAPAASPGGSGDIVPFNTLSAIKFPTPKGAPAAGKWEIAPIPTSEDGNLIANYIINGSDYWVGATVLDCNLPAVKADAGKPITDDLGDFQYCLGTATGKLKGYPMFNNNDHLRAVRLGRLALIVSPGASGDGTVKAADLEGLLGAFDLAAIAKL